MILHSAVTVSTAGLVTESQDTGGMRPVQTLPVSMNNASKVITCVFYYLSVENKINVCLKTTCFLLLYW